MGFRQFNWSCTRCGDESTHLVWANHGEDPQRTLRIDCDVCGVSTKAERVIAAPAYYTGDREMAPIVEGAKYNDPSMGRRRLGVESLGLPKTREFDKARDQLSSRKQQDARQEKFEAAQRKANGSKRHV